MSTTQELTEKLTDPALVAVQEAFAKLAESNEEMRRTIISVLEALNPKCPACEESARIIRQLIRKGA